MFDTSRRALLRSVGAAAGVPFAVRRGLARENQAGSDLVSTGSASADGRRVTFAGSIDPTARGGDWEAVGFWFADYNGFWYPTPVKRLDDFSGTGFEITATVPYSNHVFPYFAYLTDDADATREVTSFDADDSWPAERGEIRRVTVPSTAGTISVRTVDVIPNETGATVRGRIEEYGKALEIDAGAHYGEKYAHAGPLSTVVEKSPGDDPRFQVEFRDLEPDTEYTIRAVAAVPAGPISDTAYGNDVTITTGPRPDTGTHTLGVESRGGGVAEETSVGKPEADASGGVAAYEAVLSGDVSLGDDADGNEIRGSEGGGTLVRGHVGPDRGRDDFTYDGDVEALVLAGPARADVDGYEISHDAYPPTPGSVTASDLSAGGGTNTLEIRSTGGGMAAYELAVDGELRATGDAEESVAANRVEGHLGPDRGRDTFEFEGDVYEFRLAGPAVVSLNGNRIGAGASDPATVEIRSDGGGVAVYDFTVAGELRPGSDDEASEVDGRRGHGHVGPDRGVDAFEFTGGIESFGIVGPATVLIDGSAVNSDRYPLPAGALTEAVLEPTDGTNELAVTSAGGGVAAYELAVTGELRPGDDATGERISGSSVRGRVGPDRGRDTFDFTGDVTRFRLIGPATVSLNGSRIESGG